MNENKNLIFYQQAEHYTAAADISQFPNINLPEVCFAGRSNVGKSSLINSICSKRSLARTSNTPGRTQLIHFYNIKLNFYLHYVYEYYLLVLKQIQKYYISK